MCIAFGSDWGSFELTGFTCAGIGPILELSQLMVFVVASEGLPRVVFEGRLIYSLFLVSESFNAVSWVFIGFFMKVREAGARVLLFP